MFQKSGDMALTTQFQHGLFYYHYNESKERERFKREIINEVLQQISLTTNAEEIISQIKDLQKGLDDLYKSTI